MELEIEFKKAKGTPFDYINKELGWDQEHIKLNEAPLKRAFQELLPGKVITFINGPSIMIDTETGTVITEELETMKFLSVNSRFMKSAEDFNNIKSKYLYIYETRQFAKHFELRLAEFNPKTKKTVTFTIDDEVYGKFLTLSDRLAINKSKFMENRIKEFIDNHKI